MAPTYANLFMHDLESRLLDLAPIKPYLWLRYIDDIFMIWTAEEQLPLKFLQWINRLHDTISFTWDWSNGTLIIFMYRLLTTMVFIYLFIYLFIYKIYRTNTYTTYNTNIILTYIYIALLIHTVFIQVSRTNTYTTYNTSIIIFFINLLVFLLTNRFLYLHDCTYIIYIRVLALFTKQYFHHCTYQYDT